jgi:hypothetical protein
MDVKDYCKGLEQELTIWKARLFDLHRKIVALPSAGKERMLPNVEDIHMLVVEMSDRVDALRTECPSEWGTEKKEIDDAYAAVGVKYQDALNYIGAGNFGG